MRTFSNVLAALTLIPVILISAGSGLNFLRRVPTRRYAEAGALAIGLMMVGFVAFAAKGPKLGNVPALVYAPLPFLLWAAMRFGPGGLSTSLLSTDEPLPVFILLDISLPKVSGLEVLRAIKSHPKFYTIPIITLTGSADDINIQEAYTLGCNSYTVKPVDFEKFLEVASQIGIYWCALNASMK